MTTPENAVGFVPDVNLRPCVALDSIRATLLDLRIALITERTLDPRNRTGYGR